MPKGLSVTFGAFEGSHHRYLSEGAVHGLLDKAVASEFHKDVLGRHLKAGLFNYQVEQHPWTSDRLVGLLHFTHHDILSRLFNDQWSTHTLGAVIRQNMGTLTNTVSHQPYEEFAGLLASHDEPLSVEQLRSHTDHLVAWTGHLREVYRGESLQASFRKTTVSIALDFIKLIQATHENACLNDDHEPFARAGTTDVSALLETLHNTLLSLAQEGVIRRQLPDRGDWFHLLKHPDLAASCCPTGYSIPIPSIEVFETVSLQSGQAIPAKMIVSPDADSLLDALLTDRLGLKWGLLTLAPDGIQALVVQSPVQSSRYSVYTTVIGLNMVLYMGDLIQEPHKDLGGLLAIMLDEGVHKLGKEKGQLSRLA